MTGRGGGFYDEPGVLERYREHRASGMTSPNTVMEEPALLAALGDPRGSRVLDLGCGDATFGRQVLAAGASSYLGVDGSQQVVTLARSVLDGSVGRVVRADLEDYSPTPDSVDLVVSRLALHYVADVGAVLRHAHQALVEGGRLIITVLHPVITSSDAGQGEGARTSWLIDDYFAAGPRQRSWMGSTVTWFHRTVEDYLGVLRAAGFDLEALSECAPVAELFDGHAEELSRRQRVPLYLLLAAAKR